MAHHNLLLKFTNSEETVKVCRDTYSHYAGAKLGLCLAVMCVILLGASERSDAALTTSVNADQVATSVWESDTANARLGANLTKVGDVNGDGIDDFVATQRQTSRGAWVYFGKSSRSTPTVSTSDLSPNDGYRVRLASGNPDIVRGVGDVNGDGIGDFALTVGSSQSIFFGVSDATTLADCSGSGQTKCIEASDPRDLDSNRLGLSIEVTGALITEAHGLDFDGDSKDELLVVVQTGAPPSFVHELWLVDEDLTSLCGVGSGMCSVKLDELPSENLSKFTAPAGRDLGGILGPAPAVLGDVNDDGRADFATSVTTDGSAPPSVNVVYGGEIMSGTQVINDVPGFSVPAPYDVAFLTPKRIGDVDGDGLDDLGVVSVSLVSGGKFSVWTKTGDGNADSTIVSPAAGDGYVYVAADEDGWEPDVEVDALGDVNGDGLGDIGVANYMVSIDGSSNTGLAAILFGQANQSSLIELSATTDPSVAFTIGGATPSERFGTALLGVGDVDGDGLSDMYVGASHTSGQRGTARLIATSTFIGNAISGLSGNVTTKSAVLGGTVNARGRSSNAYVEYGTDTDYGATSSIEDVGMSGFMQAVEAEVDGLSPDTTYHYRLVLENDLGLKAYGRDRSFKTAVEPVDRCEQDPTQAGCPGYTGAKFCEQNPGDPVCQRQEDPKVARLSNLITGQKTLRVKRGKRGTVGLTIVNTGNAAARGIRLCVTGPKRFVAVQKCKRIGSLAAGKVATRAFKVKVKRRARKGKVIALKLTASANQLGAKTARVKVRIR